MARKAAVISIDVNAGTAKMLVDLEKGKAGLKSFGTAGEKSARQAALEMRILEGNIGNNTRAVGQLLVGTLGLGKVVQSAFAAFGIAAAVGMVATLATKVNDFFKEVQQAPAKIGAAFRGLNEPLHLTNDELQVANDRLANDIAKLEGKRQNTLKLALDEARISADKLADSLEKDLSNLAKLLKEENVGFWRRMFGKAGTRDLIKEFGGETEHEGFIGKVEGITDEGNQKIREATDAKAKDAAQTELNTRLLAAYSAEIAKVNVMLATSERDQRIHQGSSTLADRTAFRKEHNMNPYDAFAQVENVASNQSSRIPILKGILRQLGYESDSVSLQGTNTALTAKKDALTTANENAQQDRPFEDRMKALTAQLDGVKAKIAAIGQSAAVQAIAKAFGEAQKAIEEVNKSLEKRHTQLSEDQKAQLRAIEQSVASAEAEETWKAHLESTTTATNDRIRSQQLLTEAIGKGYEATKKANVETQVMGAMKENYADPAFAGDAAKLRAGFGAEYDAKHGEQNASALDKLGKQIELERELAAVQAQGAEVVRLATLAYKLQEMVAEGATREQIAKEVELYNVTRARVVGEGVDKINEKIAATEKLTAAVFAGAEAQRKAALESKYAEMDREDPSGKTSGAQRKLDEAEHQQKIAEEAGKTVAAYGDQLQRLNDIEAALQKQKRDNGDNLELEISLRDIENERLRLAVQEELKLKGASAGFKAFFLEMQEDAKSAADIIYESLNSALDKVSDQFAKLFTGQKTSFGAMFKGIGDEMVKSSVKSAMQKGLGELGKVFGIKAPAGKPDGSDPNPFYVIIKGNKGGGASPDDAALGGLGSVGGAVAQTASSAGVWGAIGGFISKLFSGGGGGGGFASSSIQFMAEGGDVDPGHGYIVGDGGEPEFFKPRTAGTITPMHKMGGNSFTYHVDARGADLGASGRVEAAIRAAHNSAVVQSVKASEERSKRSPQRSGG